MSRALPLEQAALGRWLRLSPAIFGALGLWLSAGFVRSGELDGGSLSLRVRGASLREVVWMLSRLTDQAYVVDGDVVGKVDVELREVTAAEVEARLAALGVFFTGPGTVRRVSTAPVPDLELPGTGHRVSLQWVRPGDTRDVLRLMSDIIGIEIVAPAGPLGRFSLFAEEKATADQMSAILASSGLEARRQGTRIHVRRQGEPKAVVLPLNAGGLTGHAAYRSGESAPAAQRPPGMEGYLATEARLWGLASNGDAWMAFVHTPDGSAFIVEAGYRLYDGVIESVDAGGAIARTEDGRTVVWRLQPAAEGVSGIADDLDVILERAAALRDERRFDESEHLLLSALQGWRRTDEGTRTRAALADLRFEWSQALSARGELECAVRVLEAAYEIDRADRPWQAAEDLNEMGKAWTALGEPERAVNPHREALEIARSGAERGAPRPFLCVRTHERTPWVEGDALDGLANAERVRGRLSEALALYERALSVWSSVNDPTGRSTALTGMGLVRQDLGQFEEAATLHRQALALEARHPVVRAVILNNLGNAQLGLRQLEAAQASLEEALGIYRRLEHHAGEGAVLNNLGACWEARSERDKACLSYTQALVASAQADDRRGQAITEGHIRRLIEQSAAGDRSVEACRAAFGE